MASKQSVKKVVKTGSAFEYRPDSGSIRETTKSNFASYVCPYGAYNCLLDSSTYEEIVLDKYKLTNEIRNSKELKLKKQMQKKSLLLGYTALKMINILGC